MIRGEIWWANLPDPNGSTPAKRRPVLIIQSNEFNRSKINTIICAAITSNTELASLPGNLLLEKAVSGLGKTSVVNFSQLVTIDRYDLTDQIAMLPKSMLEKINNCLRTVLEIT
jgi:mRNA interferase MazF